jgi:hypothetical protein
MPIWGKTPQSGHRGDVDDATAHPGAGGLPLGTCQHPLGHLLRGEESALGVGIQNEVVVFFRDVLQALRGADTRVVDQDVDRTDLGLRVGNGRLDGGDVGHIQCHHVGVTAFGLDMGPQGHQAVGPAAGQHHSGARPGQRLGKLFAQAA